MRKNFYLIFSLILSIYPVARLRKDLTFSVGIGSEGKG